MKNKIIIPTSLGITAFAFLVAFVSFGIVDPNTYVSSIDVIVSDVVPVDDVISSQDIEYYDTSLRMLPPPGKLFNTPQYSAGFFNVNFDSNLVESKYDVLTGVIPKYDDILVYDVYREYEYSFTAEDELEYAEFLKGGMQFVDGESGEFELVNPSDVEILEEIELHKNSLKELDGKVFADFELIVLSQDPLDGTELEPEFKYDLKGITIYMKPKGDTTTDAIIEFQSGNQIIHEVSPRIIGEFTPMKQVILVNDYDDEERLHTFPAHFGYVDDEHFVSIEGFLTKDQMSELAIALAIAKK